MSFDFRLHKRDKEFVGVRSWNIFLTPEGWRIVSFNFTKWSGPVLHANGMPTIENSNGIYAFKPECIGQLPVARVPCAGIVGLSGRVVEAETGYRAEIATVRYLNLPPNIVIQDMDYDSPYDFGKFATPANVSMRPERPTDIMTAGAVVRDLEQTYQCECTRLQDVEIQTKMLSLV